MLVLGVSILLVSTFTTLYKQDQAHVHEIVDLPPPAGDNPEKVIDPPIKDDSKEVKQPPPPLIESEWISKKF